ncbi:hypothetical protein HZB00_03910 [Candidatus Woesearchaeota archaeon]|nr:hypothetical protein [Candidatus Woesearchaeota archaeon]
MKKEDLEEMQKLATLAIQQTDERSFKLILRNLWKKYKKYHLNKDPEIRLGFAKLSEVEKIEEVYLILNNLQSLLKKRMAVENKGIKEMKTYPSFLTANKQTLEKIAAFIKDERVREKLRYIFQNIGDPAFFRRYSKRSLERNESDMDILNLIVRHGITLRIFSFIDNGRIRCCDVFINHDEYERAIASKKYMRKNFAGEEWFLIPHF